MIHRELSKVLSLLQADYNPLLLELLQPHWESSVASAPDDWESLHRACWQEWREWSGCEEQVDEVLDQVAKQVAANPQLRLLAWHCHRLIFEADDYHYSRFREWEALIPLLEKNLHASGHVFFLLLVLNAAPRLRRKNESRGVPEQISRDTLRDIAVGVRRFAKYNNGAIGLDPTANQLGWLRLVASGDLYRVGRFEYEIKPFPLQVRVYRHRISRCVIALSEADVGYDETGNLPVSRDWQGRLINQTPLWTSTLHESATVIRGNIISPRGFALPRQIELNTGDWQLALKRGDTALTVHIPEGAPLCSESCRDSFERAHEFFTTRFPERSIRAFWTNSWIFNTQLETMLPPSSNLLAWQHELYLTPSGSNGKSGLMEIFHDDEIDLATAPKDTTLRRAIISHLEAGNPLRGGTMFFLFDDLPDYGSQIYRTMLTQNEAIPEDIAAII